MLPASVPGHWSDFATFLKGLRWMELQFVSQDDDPLVQGHV